MPRGVGRAASAVGSLLASHQGRIGCRSGYQKLDPLVSAAVAFLSTSRDFSRHIMKRAFSASIASLILLGASYANAASVADCGDIDVEASAECKTEISGGCEVQCSAVSFQAACTAQVNVDHCATECTELPSVDCSGSCEASCEAECGANPDFSCSADCEGTCDTNCEAECESHDNKSECKTSCKASCSGHCSASCDGAPVECSGN